MRKYTFTLAEAITYEVEIEAESEVEALAILDIMSEAKVRKNVVSRTEMEQANTVKGDFFLAPVKKKAKKQMAQGHNNHKDWVMGWPYNEDAPHDKQWQKDMTKTCEMSGNGWWWGWTHVNCPIKDMRPRLKSLHSIREKFWKAESRGEQALSKM